MVQPAPLGHVASDEAYRIRRRFHVRHEQVHFQHQLIVGAGSQRDLPAQRALLGNEFHKALKAAARFAVNVGADDAAQGRLSIFFGGPFVVSHAPAFGIADHRQAVLPAQRV